MANHPALFLHLGELIAHVNRLSELPENWDGYGGAGPDKNTAANVNSLLKILPGSCVLAIVTDDIDPNPNGTISILWRAENGDFSIEIGTKRAACYLKLNGQIEHFNDFMRPGEPDFAVEVQSNLSRLFPDLQVEKLVKNGEQTQSNRKNGKPGSLKPTQKTVSHP